MTYARLLPVPLMEPSAAGYMLIDADTGALLTVSLPIPNLFATHSLAVPGRFDEPNEIGQFPSPNAL
jgi:hypothetical protein